MALAANTFSQLKQSFKKTFLFGNEPSAELVAILGVYFVQGILGLARLAVSFFLKDELALSPAQMGALVGVAAIPWVIKPVFGFLSDGFPLFGYRRRPYLILSGILGSLAWVALATVVQDAWQATAAILLSSLSVAISDVIVDSIVVERARKESLGQAGSLQSLTWGVSALGSLITAYLSGLLLQHFSTRTVFEITAIFPLIVCGLAWLIVEQKISPDRADSEYPERLTVNQQIRQLWQAITQKSILLPMTFILLWQATPSADSAFFYFTTNELGFEPEFLGRVRLVTSFASLIGVWVYQRFLKTISFRKLLGWSTVISAILGMTTLLLVTHTNRSLGIDDRWFSLGLILTVMGQIAFLPVLVLSARLCPPGIEASLFALLMSAWNLSGLLSQEIGALLTHWLGVTENNFEQLWLLVVITNLSTLLPLPLIGWVPSGDPQQVELSQKNASLPSAELFDHHCTGSVIESPLMPKLMPEFVTEKRDR
jgi:folate/biopterin transporter